MSEQNRTALLSAVTGAFHRGDLAGAAESLRQLLTLDPKERRVAAQLALTLARLGRLAEAYPVLKGAAPWHDVPNIYVLFMQAALAAGALEEAAAALDGLEKTRPNDLGVVLARAELCEVQGRLPDAVAALIHAADLSGDKPDIVMSLGSAAFRAGDQTALDDAVRRLRPHFERAPENQEMADWLTAALIKLRRIDEAESCAYACSEASADPIIAENSRIDRLVTAGQQDAAVAATLKALSRLSPMHRPDFRPPVRHFTAPITRLVIHNGHELLRFATAEDIASACGCPVTLVDLYTVRPETYAIPGAMIIFTGGIEAIQWKKILEIAYAAPSCPVVAWLQDNHHCYLWNALVATAADISFPAQATLIEYLATHNGGKLIGTITPASECQWPRSTLASLYQESADEVRSNRLTGKFGFHHVAHSRNRLIGQIASAWPEAEIEFADVPDYYARSSRDRFLAWRRSKTSVALPVGRDLSTRFFDALAAGQIPIVPDDIIDFDHAISPDMQAVLPVIRLRDYSVEALRIAHAEAIAAFDAGGEDAARARHKFVLDNHMLAHRIATIAREACKRLSLEFRRTTNSRS